MSARLRQALGAAAQEVVWDEGVRDLRTWNPVPLHDGDLFLTSELFSEPERPGFSAFVASRPCRLGAIFHDAIPLRYPHITWPQSVARHPAYLKMLAGFDRVWSVSEASRSDLLGFWSWQGIEKPPPVGIVPLGADFSETPRITSRVDSPVNISRFAPNRGKASSLPRLLCLGIIEPRKNQALLLEVSAELWSEGLAFELHIVGRVNPHFGAPIIARIKALRRRWPRFLHFHSAASDALVTRLYATVRATVFPTIAEGCGLPLLESLWMGVPCVCSDLPVLRENADDGGCLPVAVNDPQAWKQALQRVLTDSVLCEQLRKEATTRPLPTWSDAARTVAAPFC